MHVQPTSSLTHERQPVRAVARKVQVKNHSHKWLKRSKDNAKTHEHEIRAAESDKEPNPATAQLSCNPHAGDSHLPMSHLSMNSSVDS